VLLAIVRGIIIVSSSSSSSSSSRCNLRVRGGCGGIIIIIISSSSSSRCGLRVRGGCGDALSNSILPVVFISKLSVILR
jgi:hypothetical protein